MALRINQAGTWRNITIQCINQSATWRRVVDGCINQAGTWRCYGMTAPTVTLSNNGNIVRCVTTARTLTWSSTKSTSVASSNFGATAVSGTCNVLPTTTTTYNITTRNAFSNSTTATSTITVTLPAPGTSMQGGTLICRASSIFWIAAPATAEVRRTWTFRGDANTRSQQVSGCTGWFVPSRPQYQNPGHLCRSFWSPSGTYWTNTEQTGEMACYIRFPNGNTNSDVKSCFYLVRSFRCVTY